MAAKLIHITDLYHPHADPDDHYDLAQIFSLANLGYIDIEQVIIDYTDDNWFGDPALYSVYQLNKLTNRNVHVTLGTNTHDFVGNKQLWETAPKNQIHAPEKILEILRKSDEPVYITIVGGCLDTAIAITRDPALFSEKCAGIFLNAGSCEDTLTYPEYNVTLGREEYRTVLHAPCPVYWNPCVQSLNPAKTLWGQNATYYKVEQQKAVFDNLSDKLLNYFLYMLSKSTDGNFLRYLDKTPDPTLVRHFGALYREMWCTASIFEVAGKTVTASGNIVGKADAKDPLYTFRPAKINCSSEGEVNWQFADSGNRFIFHINHQDAYQASMTKALADILSAGIK